MWVGLKRAGFIGAEMRMRVHLLKVPIATNSTWTVYTSAKARLTSVAIWRISMNECPLTTLGISQSGKQPLYSDGDPNRHQNSIVCSAAHCQPSLKISCKSV